MRLFGHRGASFVAPENTLASISQAFSFGAHGAEFDLQRTADGRVVLLHDDTLERTGWVPEQAAPHLLHSPISELHFEALANVDVGRWKSSEYAGEKLCPFETALELLDHDKGREYLVEVKGGDYDMVPVLQSCMRAAGHVDRPLSSQVIWIGFDLGLMAALKEAFPDYRVLHILSVEQCQSHERVLQAVAAVHDAGLDGVDFPALVDIIDGRVVEACRKRNLATAVWVSKSIPGCDTATSYQAMRKAGIDMFTSDLPPDVVEAFHNRELQ